MYARAVLVLILNVPLLAAALSRYAEGVDWTSVTGLYLALVSLGYYALILLSLLTCLFLVAGAFGRLFLALSGVVLTAALFYLIADGVVFRLIGTHVDAFWLEYILTTFRGIGVGLDSVLRATLVLGVIVALEWALFRLTARVRPRRLHVFGFAALCALSFVASQALHIAAYEANDTRITSVTPRLPFYAPITSHRNALKYGNLLPMVHEVEAAAARQPPSLLYPLQEIPCPVNTERRRMNMLVILVESWRADAMDSVVTPNMYALSRRSSLFLDHFSTGNSTPTGVFPVFYGIYPTYWAAVKANNAVIHNPVLIDALQERGYAFGIYAKSHFERHKIKDTVFRGIDVHESFSGDTQDAWDRDMTGQLLTFIERQHRANRPFFGFAFYKASHFPYDYPADSASFEPARELDPVFRASGGDPTPILNDYRNSVHYVDQLVGYLMRRMDDDGILDSTMVVITGDHGEEFDDDGNDDWGHTGNFTRFQTQVPLIVFVPGRKARRVLEVTSNMDIPPTLLEEGLGCGRNVGDYSNGLDLFGPLPPRRPVVTSSYVNHAVIMDRNVYGVYPMYVDRYTLDGRGLAAGPPDPELMKQAMDGMRRFYGRSEMSRRGPGRSRAGAVVGSVGASEIPRSQRPGGRRAPKGPQ